MFQTNLLEQLTNYSPCDSRGEEHKELILQFVRGNANCFESIHPPKQGEEAQDKVGHITGSAWLLNATGQNVLLTHHKKFNKWLQLGGHSDGHNNVLETALREAKEESGISEIQSVSNKIFDIDVHEIPGKKDRSKHLHYDVRYLFTTANKNYSISDESNDLKWMPLADMQDADFEESVMRMVRKSPSLV